jgi:hypothetical protein
MIEREKVISRINAQIAVCKEIDSDFISLTVETGKRILELLDESGKEDPADYENGFHDGYQQAMKDMKKVKI